MTAFEILPGIIRLRIEPGSLGMAEPERSAIGLATIHAEAEHVNPPVKRKYRNGRDGKVWHPFRCRIKFADGLR